MPKTTSLSLLKSSSIKAAILEIANKKYPGQFNRVGKDVYGYLNAVIVQQIGDLIVHNSVTGEGQKTIRSPLGWENQL